MGKRVAAARQAAFTVLEEVAAGGYASDLLREATAHLTARDAGLAGQLVLGSLRVQNQLDYLIEKYSGRSAASLDLNVRMALRLGIFQIRYLDRIPAHAAVDDSVEFVKRRNRKASGLTNAVLRKTNTAPIIWPTEELRYACPWWLLKRWKVHFGEERAFGIADAALREPISYIRVRPGEPVPADVEATDVRGCYRLLAEPPAGKRLHDINSQAILEPLDVQPRHSYLDVCSAPGNKTTQILESHPHVAVACDISERRLKTVEAKNRVVVDGTEDLPFDQQFDRILVDAPCSGTGTLGRNPEIKWRLEETDLLRQQTRQLRILENAAQLLKTGGKLLYVTCSLEEEEDEDAIKKAAASTGLSIQKEVWRLPGEGDGFYSALLVKTSAVS